MQMTMNARTMTTTTTTTRTTRTRARRESATRKRVNAARDASTSATTTTRGGGTGRAQDAATRATTTGFVEGGTFGAYEAMDAFDEASEPLFYREGEVWRSVIGRTGRFSALWFGVVGAAQALARVVAAPTTANFFEAIADGAILTLIVAPACAAIAAFAYEAWCSVQLGLMAAFLPYTISPYSSRNPNAAARKSLVSKAMKARAMHRRFARIKAARTYAGEVCAQFATAAVEAPRRALAVALALKAFSLANVSAASSLLDALLLVALCAASVSVNLLERRRGVGKMLKEMAYVEREYLRAQTKGTFLCRWAFDPYEDPAEVNKTSKDKALTNAAVADALATSCALIGVPPEASMALVLDAADGRTSKELAAKGVPPTSIWVPNLYTHVVYALRKNVGVNAVATKVEAFLAARDPRETQLQVIYLDHCGAVDNRTQQLYDVFSRHAIADGGVLAVTFSTRGKRSGNTKAGAVQLAAKAIAEAAEMHGYVLEGDAAPNIRGLVDYTVTVTPELGDTMEKESAQANFARVLRESANAIESATIADNDGAIAAALALWLKDSEAKDASDEALETAKDRRRRRLAADLSKRALARLESGKTLMGSDARALRSLAREVVASARAAAELRDPGSERAAAAAAAARRPSTEAAIFERRYPKCLYMYKTLMFFVFRVRIAARS